MPLPSGIPSYGVTSHVSDASNTSGPMLIEDDYFAPRHIPGSYARAPATASTPSSNAWSNTANYHNNAVRPSCYAPEPPMMSAPPANMASTPSSTAITRSANPRDLEDRRNEASRATTKVSIHSNHMMSDPPVLMETVSMGSMPSSMMTTGTSRSNSNRYQEASKKNRALSLAPPYHNHQVRNSIGLVQGTKEDAGVVSGIYSRSSRDNTSINNHNEEEDAEYEQIVPGAFAVGDREERRHKGRLTATTIVTGGVDMDMIMCMEEETSATGAPSELQTEPDGRTEPNERTVWFTKREKILALGCFLLVGLPLGLGLGLGLGLFLNKDDGGKSESPTPAPSALQDGVRWKLRVKLAEFSMDGDSVFDDQMSPQKKAIEWLAEDTVWQVEDSTLRMENRYGLAVLYYSTQEVGTWKEMYEFLTDSDECTWNNVDKGKGVICNEEGQVTGIVLAENNLIGSIPEELIALNHLEALVLSNNRLSGRLPILEGLSTLKNIDWENNELEGSIPPSYDQMSALTSLNIAKNKLSGSLPGTLQSLTNLENLELHQNSIDGTIPAGLLQLKALSVVDLSRNGLSGSLPSSLGENLRGFTAFFNSLTGTFPWTTPSPLLDWVRLSGNSLNGTLPWTDIAKLGLKHLEMSENHLTGGLDDAMGQLTTMKYMNLRSNHLTGIIPTSIGNLTDMLNLRLDGNRLSSTLPSELGNLQNLQELTLYDNYYLSGTIPTELAELSELDIASFDWNNFTGSLEFLCPLNITTLSADCSDDPPMVECSCCTCT